MKLINNLKSIENFNTRNPSRYNNNIINKNNKSNNNTAKIIRTSKTEVIRIRITTVIPIMIIILLFSINY